MNEKIIEIKRPLFSLSCDDSLESHGEWAADIVTNFKDKPPGIEDGVIIQFGWAPLKLIELNNELALCEPDYLGNAFKNFKPDISTTLWTIVSQINFISDLDCEPLDFRFDDKVLFKKGCLSSDKLFAVREEHQSGDSGWYIGPDNKKDEGPPSADELEAIYAFQLLEIKPHLLNVMLLPVGWVVIWDDLQITGIINDKNETVFYMQ